MISSPLTQKKYTTNKKSAFYNDYHDFLMDTNVTGYFFNAVGDKCRNEINGSTIWKYTGVGPVSQIPNKPDRFGSYIKYFHSDPLFYSKNARKFRLSSVTIEYMNGKKTVLLGEELDNRADYTDY